VPAILDFVAPARRTCDTVEGLAHLLATNIARSHVPGELSVPVHLTLKARLLSVVMLDAALPYDLGIAARLLADTRGLLGEYGVSALVSISALLVTQPRWHCPPTISFRKPAGGATIAEGLRCPALRCTLSFI
jgi:hypothetical protein